MYSFVCLSLSRIRTVLIMFSICSKKRGSVDSKSCGRICNRLQEFSPFIEGGRSCTSHIIDSKRTDVRSCWGSLPHAKSDRLAELEVNKLYALADGILNPKS